MSINHIVDAAVDKAASAAKVKVKSMFGGGGEGDKKNQKKPGGGMGGIGGIAGIGGLFPSAAEGGSSSSKGDKGKEKEGGLSGFLKTDTPKEQPKKEASGHAEDLDFNSAIDDLATL